MRSKIAVIACIILGPLCLVLGSFRVYRDLVFAKYSVEVSATILSRELVAARKGPDQVRFTVSFTPPGYKTPQEGFFTVYEGESEEVAKRNPLVLRFLSSEPKSLRLPDSAEQSWIAVVLGILMTVSGIYRMKSLKS